MSTDSNQSLNYFISGANRGIGYELVLALLERQPGAVIFAGARDPAAAKELNDIAYKHPNVHVVKLVADDEESNKKAVEEIKKVTDRLDVVVANAGIATDLGLAHAVDTAIYRKQFEVNTLGPLFMYKAAHPLLIETREKDKDLAPPKFFVTSSGLASKGAFFPAFIMAPYGMAKAAVNYLALVFHHQTEHVGAVVVPYHPGLVLTDMNKGANKGDKDFDSFPSNITMISPAQSGAEFADLIIKATRAEQGGKFLGQGFDGEIPW